MLLKELVIRFFKKQKFKRKVSKSQLPLKVIILFIYIIIKNIMKTIKFSSIIYSFGVSRIRIEIKKYIIRENFSNENYL